MGNIILQEFYILNIRIIIITFRDVSTIILKYLKVRIKSVLRCLLKMIVSRKSVPTMVLSGALSTLDDRFNKANSS